MSALASGSYKPPDRGLTAVEPVGHDARPSAPPAAPCIAAADALPFADRSLDAAMEVISDHHWTDPIAGFREMRRVATHLVVFKRDNELPPASGFRLVGDYRPFW